MKRIIGLLLCAVLLLSLCACGGGETKTPDPEPEDAGDTLGTDDFSDAGEDAGTETAAPESLKGVDAAVRYEQDFIIDIPDGYRFDDGWSCYTNSDGVQIWARDMDIYEYDHNFEDVLEMAGVTGDGTPLGQFRYWSREAVEFYGPSTHYYVSFEGCYDDYYGCHLFASVPEGTDIKLTQTQDIIDMLTTIRRQGENVGEQGSAHAAAAPAGTEAPAETEAPHSPFEELDFYYSGEECAAMSALMNYGRYSSEGDTLVGLSFTTDGEPRLVRMDLQRSGDVPEIADYAVLDKTSPRYISIQDGFVYYNRDNEGICRAALTGGDVEVLVPHYADYLQLCGGYLWYCNGDCRLCRADLDGRNEEIVMDKEIYFPWLLDEDWLLYQDDADGETLHLRHLPSGEDARVCDEVIYNTYLWEDSLFALVTGGDYPYLAKIDLNHPEIAYDEASGSFSYSFPVEYSEEPILATVCFAADGSIYTGTPYSTSVDLWAEAVNEEGDDDFFYAYSGPRWEVYWELSEGVIRSIGLVDRTGGYDGSITYFEN